MYHDSQDREQTLSSVVEDCGYFAEPAMAYK